MADARVETRPEPRAEAERRALARLAAWQQRAVPDPAAPLEAEDVARLVPDCLAALDVDASAGAGFSVNTVHYYRRRDVIDAPVGRTAAARYGLRHVWQAAGARLAGHLGLVTLAEAREAIRGAEEGALRAFLAARAADAWARAAVRRAGGPDAARGASGTLPNDAPGVTSSALSGGAASARARPLPGVAADADGATSEALVVRLPGEAWCVVPAAHEARRSPAAARALVRALAIALGVE